MNKDPRPISHDIFQYYSKTTRSPKGKLGENFDKDGSLSFSLSCSYTLFNRNTKKKSLKESEILEGDEINIKREAACLKGWSE